MAPFPSLGFGNTSHELLDVADLHFQARCRLSIFPCFLLQLTRKPHKTQKYLVFETLGLVMSVIGHPQIQSLILGYLVVDDVAIRAMRHVNHMSKRATDHFILEECTECVLNGHVHHFLSMEAEGWHNVCALFWNVQLHRSEEFQLALEDGLRLHEEDQAKEEAPPTVAASASAEDGSESEMNSCALADEEVFTREPSSRKLMDLRTATVANRWTALGYLMGRQHNPYKLPVQGPNWTIVCSKDCFSKALDLDPRNAPAWFGAGSSRAVHGKNEDESQRTVVIGEEAYSRAKCVIKSIMLDGSLAAPWWGLANAQGNKVQNRTVTLPGRPGVKGTQCAIEGLTREPSFAALWAAWPMDREERAMPLDVNNLQLKLFLLDQLAHCTALARPAITAMRRGFAVSSHRDPHFKTYCEAIVAAVPQTEFRSMLQVLTLGAVNGISSGDDISSRILISAGILQALLPIITCDHKTSAWRMSSLRRACRVIGNFAVCKSSERLSLVESGVLKPYVANMLHHPNDSVADVVAHGVYKFLKYCTTSTVVHLIDSCEVIEHLGVALVENHAKKSDSNIPILINVVEALRRILEFGDVPLAAQAHEGLLEGPSPPRASMQIEFGGDELDQTVGPLQSPCESIPTGSTLPSPPWVSSALLYAEDIKPKKVTERSKKEKKQLRKATKGGLRANPYAASIARSASGKALTVLKELRGHRHVDLSGNAKKLIDIWQLLRYEQ